MGYKAMMEFTSWNSHTETECNPRQSAEIVKSFAEIEDRLGIPKKSMDGTKVRVDLNSQDFPGAYKGCPESTQFTAVNVKGRWTVIDISRDDCRRLYNRVSVELSEMAKAAIIKAHEQLFI